MHFVDLSIALENDSAWAPFWARNRVRYQDHRLGRWAIWLLTRLPARLLSGGLGWANEVLKLSTHGTTHVDAPYHYGPTGPNGEPTMTIDQVPLEWCYGPGVVLDMTHKGDGEIITGADIRGALVQINHTIQPNDIVLVRTGCDQLLGSRDYFTKGPGVTREATEWLLDRGVRVTGIDAWGWDGPLQTQAKRARKANRPGVFWEAHYLGLERPYCHLERLANLHLLPPVGFVVCCFPLKVKGGSAGPVRAVALVPEEGETLPLCAPERR